MLTGVESRPSDEDMAFASEILDKRYQLYTWCEEKMNTLSTVNSILLGVILALTGTVFKLASPLAVTALVACGAMILMSFVVVLIHIIPTMTNRKYDKTERNIRTTVGISRYASRDEYIGALLASDRMARFRATAIQLYGMNMVIMKNQRAIRIAVIADLAGLGLYVLAILFSTLHL